MTFSSLPSNSRTVLQVVSEHPGVSEAAILFDPQAAVVAFVVPENHYLETVLNRNKLESTALCRWQKAVELTQFVKGTEPYSVGLNTQGWNSVYTGRDIPRDEMAEWVSSCVSDILRLSPKRVYEIGCGTGMLLLQIAPECERYVGVDFSPATLSKLREQLKTFPSLLNKVEVIERRADEFGGLARTSFDTILINSVIFYFPNLAYLNRVLEGAIDLVEPGGHIFVGDILSLHLLPLLASSIELFLAADQLPVTKLPEQISRRVDLQSWLFVSPAYFLSLPERFPRVSRVEIRPRLGRASNEVTGFRFNAIIHVDDSTSRPSEIVFEDWTERRFSLEEIREMLHHRGEAFGIMRIRNLRLDRDLNALEKVLSAGADRTVAELKKELADLPASGIHPQDLVDCAEGSRFRVELSWADCRPDGSYDAFFYPMGATQGPLSPAIFWPKPEQPDLFSFANWPGQQKCRCELIESILAHCQRNLPDELVPSDVILVDALPKTPDGPAMTEALRRYRQLHT